ncbi:MAG: peptidase T [Dorea sp.]|nr:peptidase T [Dorea sp.]
MKAYERLLKYVVIKTPSDEHSTASPSSACQFVLANALVKEMKEMGLSDVFLDEHCYVYGKLPATPGYENKMKLGFVAHTDTVAPFADVKINRVIDENDDGQDVELQFPGRKISKKLFPHLENLKGRTLITTDGYTILGADDKAGIAEILTMCEVLIKEEIPHGQISVAFTPDEEIGGGAELLDLERFGAEYAFTLDGGEEGEIQYENFNAAVATFDIDGYSIHPGESKGRMVNALLVAMQINNSLPSEETPRGTEGYEGFYHLCHLTGECDSAHMEYIIRDHSKELFEAKKATLRLIAKNMNRRLGSERIVLNIKDQYANMASIMKDCMHLIDHAKIACERAGIEPIIRPIRGGTDGARLSFRGLPCPNLGTGGYAYHGPYEHITVEGMDKTVDFIVELVKIYAE